MDDEVALRPLREADLESLDRFAHEPDALGPFEWFGFRSTQTRRERWANDRWIGEDSAMLGVTAADDTLLGIASFQQVAENGPRGGSYEIGIALFPEHGRKGIGTKAQALLVDYLFRTTLAHRLSAVTDNRNVSEQRALARLGFQREGVMREAVFRDGAWRDLVMYSLLHQEHESGAIDDGRR